MGRGAQEIKFNETLNLRVEKVLKFETKLAAVSEDDFSSDGSGGLLGTMIQKMFLFRNTNFDPIKTTAFTDKLDSILDETDDSVLSDYMLLNIIINVGENLMKQTKSSDNLHCADLVYQHFPATFRSNILTSFLDENINLTNRVIELLLEETWVPEESVEVLMNISSAFKSGSSIHSDVQLGKDLIDVILDLESQKSGDIVYQDLMLSFLESKIKIKNLLPKSNTLIFISNIQTILTIYISVIKFETKKDNFEKAIDVFNRDTNLNVTNRSFVEDASFFLTFTFAEKLMSNDYEVHLCCDTSLELTKSEVLLVSLISQNCQMAGLKEKVLDTVHQTFHCQKTSFSKVVK